MPSLLSRGWPDRLRPEISDLSKLWAPRDTSRLANKIHNLGFGRYSDRELKNALAYAQDDVLPWVFGIVHETVSRRLGTWRLFSQDNTHPLHDISRSIVTRGSYRSNPTYDTDYSYLDSPEFANVIQDAAGKSDLSSLDNEIVRGMVYVAEKGRTEYTTNIHLPARFYEAVASQDSERLLWMRATDEQLKAGELLYHGRVVEMEAGEGKTIAAAFPAVLHITQGRKVHIITANDYLALRDAEWLAPVYESLGLTVRAVLSTMEDEERRDAYRADVVYSTVRELGFDYLRDNMKFSAADMVQGSLEVAIVDEVDQVLVDESQTPLIISGSSTPNKGSVHRADKVVGDIVDTQNEVVESVEVELRKTERYSKRHQSLLVRLTLANPHSEILAHHLIGDGRLRSRIRSAALVASSSKNTSETPVLEGLYYHVDLEHGLVTLTDLGHQFVENRVGPLFEISAIETKISEIQSDQNTTLEERRVSIAATLRRLSRRQSQMNQVHQALTAHLLLRKDDDYVITEDTVVLVDGLTGRARPDSRYQHGLQSAIEAKEGVHVRQDSAVLAQISIQGFIKQYQSIAGMSGTAVDAQDELRHELGLSVSAVPPRRASKRVDQPTRVYITLRDKLSSVVDEVGRWNRMGRPVLIGTTTVEQSEEISQQLSQYGITHQVLNAVQNAKEAEIVKSAGRLGAVTVATNMAGRGTDIPLDMDLDNAIAARGAEVISEILNDGTGEVRVDCETRKDENTLKAILADVDELQVSQDGTSIVVSHTVGSPSPDPPSSIEFGCGLRVIGTEMNDSRRVDAQLRGRAGRQGSSGSSGFVLSLEDWILAHSGIGKLPKVDAKLDAAGRPFFEGRTTTHILDSNMSWREQDTVAGRTIMSDYQRVLEEQTLTYYRARRDILADNQFYATCIGLAEEASIRMVELHFQVTSSGQYADQFYRMSDEARLDYGLNCQPMWGLGIEALSEEIVDAVTDRIVEVRVAVGTTIFDNLAKICLVQTADEAWQAHLGMLDGMTAAMLLSPWGHRTAVADFSARCREAYIGFQKDVVDSFVPRLLDTSEHKGDEPETAVETVVLSELQAILE